MYLSKYLFRSVYQWSRPLHLRSEYSQEYYVRTTHINYKNYICTACYLNMRLRIKPLLILDLNGVLVLVQYYKAGNVRADYKVNGRWVYKRKGLREFLNFVFEHFDVAIWTSRKRHNAEAIVNRILTKKQLSQLKFLRTRENCKILEDGESRKEVWRLKDTHYKHIFVLDDTPEKIESDTDQTNIIYIPVKSFVDPATEDSSELGRLKNILWNQRVNML